MEIFGAIVIGILLGLWEGFTLFFVIRDLKRLIFCAKNIDAKVKSVTEEVDEHKDPKTGKKDYRYSYTVEFEYEYNGQTYETSKNYSNHCSFVKNTKTDIKINPHNPKEIWTRGELIDLLKLASAIPLFVFFDLIYVNIVF